MYSRKSTVFGGVTLAVAAAFCGAAALAETDTTAAAKAGAMGKSGADAGTPLKQIHRTELPEYKGDFDQFGVDVKGNRLFLAGEEGSTLEVFDLKSGERIKTMKEGFEEPHSIHYIPEKNRLIITDAGDSMTKVVDAKNYKIVDTIKLVPGADIMEYDPATKHVWIVSGGKNAKNKLKEITVSEVDPATGKVVGDELKFDTDYTKALAFEQKGNRAFINVGGKSYVAVIDKKTHKVLNTWPIKEGENNAPMQLDEKNHRLFVVTRKPFKLVVLNTDTGASVASFKAPERTNGLIFDEANHRIYLTGDNEIAVFEQKGPDQYEQLASVPSAHGAKTGILVPELNRLYVAVSPGEATGGAVLTYSVAPKH